MNSDHFTQYMDLQLEYKNKKTKRVEVLDYKNKESQSKFRILTTDTKEFYRWFESNRHLEKQFDDWMYISKQFCQKSFKKIRIKKRN